MKNASKKEVGKQTLTKGTFPLMILLLNTFGSDTERSLVLENDSSPELFKLGSSVLKKSSSGSESNLQQEAKLGINQRLYRVAFNVTILPSLFCSRI